MNFQDLLTEIESVYSQNLPFVAYRNPNEAIVKSIFQNDATLHFLNDFSFQGFVFAPFDNKEQTVLIPLESSNIYNVESPVLKISLDGKTSNQINKLQKKKHIKLVKKGVEFIEKGGAKKIVLSRKEDVKVENFSLTKTFSSLLYNYSNAFVYVWFHPKVGLWLGATPETLIKVNENKFKTMSLAGTQAYRDSINVDWQKKELVEQQIVTDYIVSKLSHSIENLELPKPYTVKAGNLLHLRTDISGLLTNKSDLSSVLKILHPTPAVCGMPKNIAKQFIQENENYDREFYTGFLGELNIKNNSNFYVNLRCMKINNAVASIFVGGGITADSIAENEWQETVEKSKVMKKVLLN